MEKTIKGLNCDYMDKSKREDSIEWAQLDRANHILGKGIGTYMCYCKIFSDTGMFTKKEDLCYQYQYEHFFGKFFTWIIAIIIVLTNSIIEKIFNFLTLKIGYKYKS